MTKKSFLLPDPDGVTGISGWLFPMLIPGFCLPIARRGSRQTSLALEPVSRFLPEDSGVVPEKPLLRMAHQVGLKDLCALLKNRTNLILVSDLIGRIKPKDLLMAVGQGDKNGHNRDISSGDHFQESSREAPIPSQHFHGLNLPFCEMRRDVERDVEMMAPFQSVQEILSRLLSL